MPYHEAVITDPIFFLGNVAYIPVGMFIDPPFKMVGYKSLSIEPTYTAMPPMKPATQPSDYDVREKSPERLTSPRTPLKPRENLMSTTREEICKSAGAKLTAALARPSFDRRVVGFDGFVDEIIAVVDKRHDKDRYDAVRTIEAMGRKVLAAAGQSSNYELLVKQIKLGGNGPIMANALAAMGLGVTYIGNLGFPALHPVFTEFSERATVISIAEPGHTDALEFEDGKLMLGKHQSLHDITWENLTERVGRPQLMELFGGPGWWAW